MVDEKQAKADLEQILKQERHALLVLNELYLRMQPFCPKKDFEQEIDLLSIADSLKESAMSVKQTQKCWDLIRKRMRDVQKRESEFSTHTRIKVTEDFCYG